MDQRDLDAKEALLQQEADPGAPPSTQPAGGQPVYDTSFSPLMEGQPPAAAAPAPAPIPGGGPQYQHPMAPPSYQQAPPPGVAVAQQGAAYPAQYAQPVAAHAVSYQHGPGGVHHVIVAPGSQIVVLDEHPARMQCPRCRQNVLTNVNHSAGTLTCLGVLCCLLVGCWPCSWIPCVMEDFQDVEHSCPNCRALVGVYRRI